MTNPTFSATGMNGHPCVLLGAGSVLTVANPLPINNSTPMTLMAVIKASGSTVVSGGVEAMAIAFDAAAGDFYSALSLCMYESTPALNAETGVADVGNADAGGAALGENQTFLLALVNDGTTVHCYVNGVQIGAGSPYGSGPTVANNLTLGSQFDLTAASFASAMSLCDISAVLLSSEAYDRPTMAGAYIYYSTRYGI
jgi:hypothetical protein